MCCPVRSGRVLGCSLVRGGGRSSGLQGRLLALQLECESLRRLAKFSRAFALEEAAKMVEAYYELSPLVRVERNTALELARAIRRLIEKGNRK